MYIKEKITKEQFKSFYLESKETTIREFNTNFATAGECSTFSHIIKLYGVFQECIYDVQNPFLIAGKSVITYMVIGNFLPILHGKLNHITKLGSILRDSKPVPVIKETRFCKGCGAPVVGCRCEYCQSSETKECTKIEIGSLDVYAIPEGWDTTFNHKILCLSEDYEVKKLIKLHNIYF